MFPNVYLSASAEPSLEQRIAAAWLWSKRRGDHRRSGRRGAARRQVDSRRRPGRADLHTNPAPPRGVLTRRDVLIDGESQVSAATRSPLRSAPPSTSAGAARFIRRSPGLIRLLAQRVSKSTTCCGLREATRRFARGFGSWRPRSSWSTRVRSPPGRATCGCCSSTRDLPRPQTQIPVLGVDGIPVAYLDLGWEEYMVGGRIRRRPTSAPTGANTSKTFGGWRCSRRWAGSSSGSSPRTAACEHPAPSAEAALAERGWTAP